MVLQPIISKAKTDAHEAAKPVLRSPKVPAVSTARCCRLTYFPSVTEIFPAPQQLPGGPWPQ